MVSYVRLTLIENGSPIVLFLDKAPDATLHFGQRSAQHREENCVNAGPESGELEEPRPTCQTTL